MTQPTIISYGRHLRAQGYAPNTVRAKLGVLTTMTRQAGIDARQLTLEHVEAYLDRDLSAWSRRKYLEHLRGFARWAGIPDPTEGLRPPPPPRAVPRPVSEDHLQLLFAVALPRTKAFLMLGAFAGLRSFEIAKVGAGDLELTPTGHALWVRGKGGRLDLLPVPSLVARGLRPWIEAARGGRLWPGLTAAAVQQAVARCARQADITMTCHQLRHRYGTALYATSHDLLLVQQLMRHASPSTTAGYALVAHHLAAELVTQLPVPEAV